MKKIMAFLFTLILLVSSGTTSLDAEFESSILYKYVKNPDGSYGYDTSKPVPYYNGSDEYIEIPNTYSQKKEQFKSTWIATIFNIHFPQTSDFETIKQEYLTRLDTIESMNMNAVIFQVRPVLDAAFYQSDINPTSAHFTGKQGLDAGFDPMPWMIDETHNRGLEFHAWFNPYRVTNTAFSSIVKNLSESEIQELSIKDKIEILNDIGYLADNNFAVLNPDYVLEFQGKFFLNPGEPKVIGHVVDTLKEFMTKYDTDAIHFDDYFYPYRSGDAIFGTNGEDLATYEKYGQDYDDIESWRRANVTALIDAVKAAIDQHNASNKTAVQFGVSPFGIWEHKANDDRGSNTPASSSQSYSTSIFADTYSWIKDNKLDYVAPQIYWSFASAAAPYGELARWWNNVAEGTDVDVYVGHANYKTIGNASWDSDWMNPEEINNQLKFNQTLDNITGSAIYSYNDLVFGPGNTPAELAKNDSISLLMDESFSTPSLTPSRKKLSWNDTFPIDKATLNGKTLTWFDTKNTNARFYVIYAGSESTLEAVVNNPSNIVKRVKFEGKENYTLELNDIDASKTIAITVLDRAFVESQPIGIDHFTTTITNKHLEYKQGKKISESQFINDLDILANHDYVVSTDFAQQVIFTKRNTYSVTVKLTSKSTNESQTFTTTVRIYNGSDKPSKR